MLKLLLALSTALVTLASHADGRAFDVSTPSRVPAFGVLGERRAPLMTNILAVRGGAVHECTTLADLDSRIQSAALNDKLTVIDFTATWCGPCKQIAPVFHELSDQHNAVFVKVDVDENPEAAQKYGVSAMPTFVFVKGGEVVDQLMGANTARLKELIEEWA